MKDRFKYFIRGCFFIYSLLFHLFAFSSSSIGLEELEERLSNELEWINYPPRPWRYKWAAGQPYDVIIVGSGMSGMTAGFALLKQGVTHIQIFDAQPEGLEGPWLTFARMPNLRSGKSLMGPALGISHLTFHAWFEAQYGREAWNQLRKIPTKQWMDYLKWYRQVLNLPVKNNCKLISLRPHENLWLLIFEKNHQQKEVLARKVVLATGRGGFGGMEIPEFVNQLPKKFYSHTAELIDFNALKGKSVGIIGVGASGFDAAATALESGAKQVDMWMRRSQVPSINKLGHLSYAGYRLGFYQLEDVERWNFLAHGFQNGSPPPHEAIERVKGYPNLFLHPNTQIEAVKCKNEGIELTTNHGAFQIDYLILATGFAIDGSKQPELKSLIDSILLWQDRLPSLADSNRKMGRFPYLGDHFQFLEKTPGIAPYLKNLYCFNYGATLSHGHVSGDIPGISTGAIRLAEGIAADLFKEDWQLYYQRLLDYDKEEFSEKEIDFKAEIKKAD